jgi:coenzyme F420 biosynthesis associated uncharacterized protein
MVDWNVAVNTARKLVRPGPTVSMDDALSTVAELRDAAQRAEDYVETVTGLTVPSATAPVLVVDRPGWIQANADAFATVMEPLNEKAAKRLNGASSGAGQTVAAVSSRVSGAEVGALLSYLAPKILGQFDPFHPGAPGEPGGRLLLVAPNVVMVERELDLVPSDFRLWVCLHEETHRVQFTAVPWLRRYMNAQVEEIANATELDPAALLRMAKNGASRLGEAIRQNQEISIIDLVQTPAQRAVVERITAVMSLLEGHADVVMDSVGPGVVPSVETIRARFNVRRQSRGMDRMIRKMLGLDAKMRQYRDGAKFCNQVIESVGMTGFNRVWEGPQMLPTPAEIADPLLWVARVHSDTTIARHEAEQAVSAQPDAEPGDESAHPDSPGQQGPADESTHPDRAGEQDSTEESTRPDSAGEQDTVGESAADPNSTVDSSQVDTSSAGDAVPEGETAPEPDSRPEAEEERVAEDDPESDGEGDGESSDGPR